MSERPIICPRCKYEGELDDFDNFGASNEINLFCTQCNCEFDFTVGFITPPDATQGLLFGEDDE